MRRYHISINSFYIEIVKIRYSCDTYIKYHIKYFDKMSGNQISESKNVKIMKSVKKHWEIWDGN